MNTGTVPFTKGMNSKLEEFQGKVSWVRMVNLNRYDKWSVTLHPNAESLERIRELQADGLKNVIKKDEDGYYIQFSRPPTIELRKGVKTGVTPPVITDKDGRPLEGVAVGNGTDATVILEVYTHPVPNSEKRATAARLAGLRVENLVPFDIKSDYTDKDQAAIAQKAADTPQQMW